MIINRECKECNACCVWLHGEAHGHQFGGGKPCHFLNNKEGCWKCLEKAKELKKDFISKMITGKILNYQGILEPRSKILVECDNGHRFWRRVEDLPGKWCLECKKVEIEFDD